MTGAITAIVSLQLMSYFFDSTITPNSLMPAGTQTVRNNALAMLILALIFNIPLFVISAVAFILLSFYIQEPFQSLLKFSSTPKTITELEKWHDSFLEKKGTITAALHNAVNRLRSQHTEYDEHTYGQASLDKDCEEFVSAKLSDSLCPIGMDIPSQPIYIGSHLFDRSAIIETARHNPSNPLTRAPLNNDIIIQSTLKSAEKAYTDVTNAIQNGLDEILRR